MREDRENSSYYHGGLASGRDVRDFDRDTRDGDFGREHQDRYRNGNNPHDFRDRRDFDAHRFQTYPRNYQDLKDDYYEHTQGSGHELTNVRQRYGFPGFESSHDDADERVRHMQRERRAQEEQEYGAGRMSGYSGSRFGGANYSAHGDFGGAPHYGSMSGRGGDMERTVSSSGYGGGHRNASMHQDRVTHSDRGEPNYWSHAPHERHHPESRSWKEERHTHRGHDNRTDRGGYHNYDPNY